MAINEAGVMMVNAKLNMNNIRKELDLFFSSTVKNIKTTIDFSNLVNSLKMVEPSVIKVSVEMNETEPAQKLEKSMGKSLGVIGAGVGAVGTGISKWANLTFGDQFDIAKTAILDAGAALGTDLAPAITGVSEGVREFSTSLTEAAATGGLDKLLETLPGALNMFLESLPDYLTQLIDGVTSLLAGIGEVLPEIIPPLLETAMQLLIELVANLPQLMEAALQIIMGLANGIIAAIPTLLEQLPVLIEGIINFILTAVPQLIETGVQLFVALVEALPQIIETIVLAIPEIINGLITAIIDSIPQIIQAGIDLMVSLIQNLPEIIETIVLAIPEIINGLITAIIDSIPQIIQAGIDLLVSLIQNLPEIITTLVTAIPQIVLSLVNAIVGNIDQIILAGVQLFMALIENLPTIIIEIVKAVPQIISSLVNAFAQMASTMGTIGLDLVKGIFNGISNSVQWLYEKLRGWVGNVVKYLKELFGINSPSKVMRDTVGIGIAEGVAVGILENTDLVSDAMSEMADVVTDSNISVEPEVKTGALDFESFKEKIRPSLDFVKTQIARARETLNTQFAASMQLAGVMAGAAANNTYNNGNTFNNHYTITAANYSPKATADAIKSQMTMQRMLFATR